jgi:hypothetical protein
LYLLAKETTNMPRRLEYVVDWGKKVLKNIRVYFGLYPRGKGDIYINKHPLEMDDSTQLKTKRI